MGVHFFMTNTNTTIADLVPNEKVLGATVNALLPERNAFIKSGVAVRSPIVDRIANAGTRKVSVPYIKPLDTTNVNYGTDNINTMGATGKLEAGEFAGVRHVLNYGWGTADLVTMVTQYDAKGGIQAGIADYWATIFQKIAVASLSGALASDASLTVGTGSAALSLGLVTDAAVTGGDYMDLFDTLVVTPVTYGKLIKADQNDFIPASKTDTGFSMYAGKKLIVASGFGNTSSILCRSGALAFGTGSVLNPFEIERVANGGNGQGGDILHSRQTVVVHPQGFNFLGDISDISLAGVADEANWEMAVELEQVPFRLISHT